MYKKESINKAVKNLVIARKHFDEISVDEIRLAISKGNRKIGRVMNVSLPPILTCANCSECMYYCYDVKAVLQYPNTVVSARARNLSVLARDRDAYFAQIDAAISRRRVNKFFRWHVSGDIVDIAYFDRMVTIARNHTDFVFWTYTKNYDVVNEWIRENGNSRLAIPGNLHIMFSEWRGLEMRNPYGMPEFRVVFKDDVEKPAGFYCPGNCDICKEKCRGCLAGETTYCHEH